MKSYTLVLIAISAVMGVVVFAMTSDQTSSLRGSLSTVLADAAERRLASSSVAEPEDFERELAPAESPTFAGSEIGDTNSTSSAGSHGCCK
jgi:hypothetical protein